MVLVARESLVEGVGVGPNHHHHLLERVRSSSELSPVDPILVSASVMAPTVPDPIEVGVSTGIVPPSSLLIVGTVSCRREWYQDCLEGSGFALSVVCVLRVFTEPSVGGLPLQLSFKMSWCGYR